MYLQFFFLFGVQNLLLQHLLSIRRKQRTRSCVVLFRRKNVIRLRGEARSQSGSEGECITLEATLQVNLNIQTLIMEGMPLWVAQWPNNSTMEPKSALPQHEMKPWVFFFVFRFYLTFLCADIFFLITVSKIKEDFKILMWIIWW